MSYSSMPYHTASHIRTSSRQPSRALLKEGYHRNGSVHHGNAEHTPMSSRRRVPVACGRCRKRKIRCTGDPGDGSGCSACKAAGVGQGKCVFLRVQCSTLPLREQTATTSSTSINPTHFSLMENYDADPYSLPSSNTDTGMNMSVNLRNIQNTPSQILSSMAMPQQTMLPLGSSATSLPNHCGQSVTHQPSVIANYDNSGLSMLATNALCNPDPRRISTCVAEFRSSPLMEPIQVDPSLCARDIGAGDIGYGINNGSYHRYTCMNNSPIFGDPPLTCPPLYSASEMTTGLMTTPTNIGGNATNLPHTYTNTLFAPPDVNYAMGIAYPHMTNNFDISTLPPSTVRYDCPTGTQIGNTLYSNIIPRSNTPISTSYNAFDKSLGDSRTSIDERSPSTPNTNSLIFPSANVPFRYAQYTCATPLSTCSVDIYRPSSVIEYSQPILSAIRSTSADTSLTPSDDATFTNKIVKEPIIVASSETCTSTSSSPVQSSNSRSTSIAPVAPVEPVNQIQKVASHLSVGPNIAVNRRRRRPSFSMNKYLQRPSSTGCVLPSTSRSLLDRSYTATARPIYYQNHYGLPLSGRC